MWHAGGGGSGLLNSSRDAEFVRGWHACEGGISGSIPGVPCSRKVRLRAERAAVVRRRPRLRGCAPRGVWIPPSDLPSLGATLQVTNV